MFQTIEAARVPASRPTGGKEGSFLTFSQPSRKDTKSFALIAVGNGARSQTLAAYRHWNRRCVIDSIALQRG